jgi:hypothetical protein
MFQQILFLQWKGSRYGLLPLALLAFGLPIVAVQGLVPGVGAPEAASVRASILLFTLQGWAPAFPGLAFALGATLALMVWNGDHRGEHVYPLSLPLPRWKYVLLKGGAGAVLLCLPVALLWLGSLLATSFTDIPEGLRAYPSAITFRFLLASLVAFAVFFALAAGTMRTAVALLCAWVGFLILGELLPPFLGEALNMPALESWSLLEWILESSTVWPGPFEVYTGNWMLIDV